MFPGLCDQTSILLELGQNSLQRRCLRLTLKMLLLMLLLGPGMSFVVPWSLCVRVRVCVLT